MIENTITVNSNYEPKFFTDFKIYDFNSFTYYSMPGRYIFRCGTLWGGGFPAVLRYLWAGHHPPYAIQPIKINTYYRVLNIKEKQSSRASKPINSHINSKIVYSILTSYPKICLLISFYLAIHLYFYKSSLSLSGCFYLSLCSLSISLNKALYNITNDQW